MQIKTVYKASAGINRVDWQFLLYPLLKTYMRKENNKICPGTTTVILVMHYLNLSTPLSNMALDMKLDESISRIKITDAL